MHTSKQVVPPKPAAPITQLRAIGMLLPLVSVFALSGCGTSEFMKKHFDNRLLMTMDCKEVRTCSEYGPFCIGTKINESDAAAVINLMCRPAAK